MNNMRNKWMKMRNGKKNNEFKLNLYVVRKHL